MKHEKSYKNTDTKLRQMAHTHFKTRQPDKYIYLKIIKDFIHHVIMLKLKDDFG